MSTTGETPAVPDPLFASQLSETADRPFVWSPQARPLSTLRTWLNAGLVISIIGEILLIFASAGFIRLESTVDPDTYDIGIDPELYTTLFGLVAIVALCATALYLIGFVLVAVFHSRLVYRATKNLILSKARNIDFSPSWAVWVHYIPIISLWMPIGKVSRIYAASLRPLKTDGPSSMAIGWWWGLLIVSGIISTISLRLYNAAEAQGALEMMIATYWMDIVSSVMTIISSVLLIRIHRNIDAAQTRLQAEHTAQPIST